MTDLIVGASGVATFGAQSFRCAVGHNGIVAATAKREGDGCTPAGRWPFRKIFYRADRVATPVSALSVHPLTPQDGWCDAPDDPRYNRLVQHPYPASAEHLWREDHIYDVVAVLGHNDTPVVPGMGSAIFFHVARHDYAPSTGCVTMKLEDMLTVLREVQQGDAVEVRL